MAPAVGPTTALAMCAAAFVGWRVPSQQALSFAPDDPEVSDSLDAVHSDIGISNDVCESASVQEQYQHSISEDAGDYEFGHSDSRGGAATDNDWERENGAVEVVHDSKASHEGNETIQPSSSVDGDDCSMSWCSSKSIELGSVLEISNGSVFDQGACLQVTGESVEGPDSCTFSPDSFETGAVLHNTESGSLTEFANTEAETVAEVKEPESNTFLEPPAEPVDHNSDFRGLTESVMMEAEAVFKAEEPESNIAFDISVGADAFIHNDEFGTLEEVASSENTSVSDMTQRKYEVDMHADQDVEGLEDDVAAGGNTRAHNQSNIFEGMPEKLVEFLLWLCQVWCTECRKVLSDENLEKASGMLHQLWLSFLAISRQLLGDTLFLKVSSLMVDWWPVVLLSFTSLIDLVIYGVFGRAFFRSVRSCCRRGSRREQVLAEVDVADTQKNADSCEKLIVPSDECSETAHAGTSQVHAQIDVQREVACSAGSFDAMKHRPSPFNSSIQIRNIPTPARRVAAVRLASSQNATSAPPERV